MQKTKFNHAFNTCLWSAPLIYGMSYYWNGLFVISFCVFIVISSLGYDLLDLKVIEYKGLSNLNWLWLFCFALSYSIHTPYFMSFLSVIFAGFCWGILTSFSFSLKHTKTVKKKSLIEIPSISLLEISALNLIMISFINIQSIEDFALSLSPFLIRLVLFFFFCLLYIYLIIEKRRKI